MKIDTTDNCISTLEHAMQLPDFLEVCLIFGSNSCDIAKYFEDFEYMLRVSEFLKRKNIGREDFQPRLLIYV